MKKWLRRLGYFVLIIIWLMVMCFPTFAFVLATNERIELGSNPRNHVRFFLVREEADGIGVEWARPLLGQSACAKTTVAYLLWEGAENGQSTSFCQCYDPESNAPLPIDENSCG